MKAKDPAGRDYLLKRVIALTQARYPERGGAYRSTLEDISTAIRSTQAESALIQREKGVLDPGRQAQDTGARTLSAIVAETKKWKKENQWDFIKYLRGDIEATKFIQKNFRTIGPERVRRMYTLLPTFARAGLIDVLLEGGLLPKTEMGQGYTRRIVEHLVRAGNPKEKEVSIQILDAFLQSQRKVGDGALQSSTLGYLLAVSKKGDRPMSAGEVLKNVLEQFGTSGVKIGQFLSAANILSPEENKHLNELHDNANKPERETIYRDLREILGVDASGKAELPVKIGDVLGSASIKYTVGAVEAKTGEEIVLKVLRLSALAQTPTEFRQLEAMADYLRRVYGPRFGIFKSIVRASRRAVEKELSLSEEVKKGRLAGKVVYPDRVEGAFEVHVPREVLVKDRLIAAEFAPGAALSELPTKTQEIVTTEMLRMEEANLFSNKSIIYFDPDRHPGNSRVKYDEKTEKVKFGPIDFGQLSAITREQRDQVIDLFALSQVLAKTGKTTWGTNQIASMMGLDKKQTSSLGKKLANYFPAKSISEPAAYFSVLSALEEAGKPTEIVFYDYVRGIIQHSRHESGVAEGSLTPTRTFTERVTARANSFAVSAKQNMKNSEKIRYVSRAAVEEVRSYLSDENPKIARAKEVVTEIASRPSVKVPVEFSKGAGQTYLAELISAVFWGLVDRDKAKAEEFLKSLMTADKHVGFAAFAVAAELYKAVALSATDLASAKLRYLHAHGGSMAIGMVAADLTHRILHGETWEKIADEMATMPYGTGVLLSTANFMVAGAIVGKTFDKIQNSPNFKILRRVTGCPDIFGKLGRLAGTFVVAEGLDRAYKETIMTSLGYDAKSVAEKKVKAAETAAREKEHRDLVARVKEEDRIYGLREKFSVSKPELLNPQRDHRSLLNRTMGPGSWLYVYYSDRDKLERTTRSESDSLVRWGLKTIGVEQLKKASGGKSGKALVEFARAAIDDPKFISDNAILKSLQQLKKAEYAIKDRDQRDVFVSENNYQIENYLSTIELIERDAELVVRADAERKAEKDAEFSRKAAKRKKPTMKTSNSRLSQDAGNNERVRILLEPRHR